MPNNLIVLVILDGWGLSPSWGGNAISLAKTPFFDNLWQSYPHSILAASGPAVGLPGHEMGNSEVGHLTIGAGRVILHDSSRIKNAILDGSFFTNPFLIKAMERVKNTGTLHLIGLVSDGNIHSHIDHLFALLILAKKIKVKSVLIHGFTDGRDTPPMSALEYFSRLEDKIKEEKLGRVATISGRFYGMDRDHHWDRTEKVYRAIVEGKGEIASSSLQAISLAYAKGLTDEFLPSTVILGKEKMAEKLNSGDSIIFFNFRSDRIRQITRAFTDPKFKIFGRPKLKDLYFVTMIPYYERELKLPITSAFKDLNIENTLGEIIAERKLKQFRLAETEKYAHVTYFFNGLKESPFPGEERFLVPSPHVPSYDLVPEMSAEKITEIALEKIKKRKYNLIVTNFANPDMVGHSGNLKATIGAIETLDPCLEKIVKATISQGGVVLISADHGNAEQMINPVSGEPWTEHTTNPVPFILVSNGKIIKKIKLKEKGSISQISPFILSLLGIKIPKEMEKPLDKFEVKEGFWQK